MEIPIEYNLAGQPWGKKEDEQLIKEYNIDKLNLLDICKIHKRMPGGITSRLKRLNLVDMKCNTRGYQDYQQSELYKEISTYRTENRLEKRTDIKNACIVSEENTIIKSNHTDRQKARLQRKQIPSDIIELKNDVKEIKEKIDEILRLMNAVYTFENE